MSQSRRMSFLEAGVNVVAGYSLALCTQIVAFPWFGLHPSLGENLAIGAFSWVSRSFAATHCADCSSAGASAPNSVIRSGRTFGQTSCHRSLAIPPDSKHLGRAKTLHSTFCLLPASVATLTILSRAIAIMWMA
jgi:hypothetical protein